MLSGRKTWSTLSPALHFFIVTAGIDGTDEVGSFLVTRDTPGIRVDETWDSLGMRATGSHDVVLDEVHIPKEALLERRNFGQYSIKTMDGNGCLLHIAAC